MLSHYVEIFSDLGNLDKLNEKNIHSLEIIKNMKLAASVTPYVIRPYRAGDFAEVVSMMSQLQTFFVKLDRAVEKKPFATPAEAEAYMQQIQKDVKQLRGLTLVATSNKKIIGFIQGVILDHHDQILHRLTHLPSLDGWIGLFFIDPNFRGQRIGVALLNKMKAYFQKHHCQTMRLFVAQNNQRGIKIYQKYGFKSKEVEMAMDIAENHPVSSQTAIQSTPKLFLLFPVLLALIFVVFVLVTSYKRTISGANNSKLINQQLAATPPANPARNETALFTELSTQFATITQKKITTISDQTIIWQTEDGLTIFIPNVSGLQISAGHDLEYVKNTVEPFIPIVQQAFVALGFTLNQLNSSKTINDQKVAGYTLAYENANLKCEFQVETQSNTTGNSANVVDVPMKILCTPNYQQAYDDQQKFAAVYRNKGVGVNYKNVAGDFASVNVSNGNSGSNAILKLEGDQYQIIFSGQDIPSCALINKYQIPKGIVAECLPVKSLN